MPSQPPYLALMRCMNEISAGTGRDPPGWLIAQQSEAARPQVINKPTIRPPPYEFDGIRHYGKNLICSCILSDKSEKARLNSKTRV